MEISSSIFLIPWRKPRAAPPSIGEFDNSFNKFFGGFRPTT
jgi:hypothetical protein